MGKTFLLCEILKFDDIENYMVPKQETLLDDEGSAEVNFELLEKVFYKDISKYAGHHDFKVKRKGRTKNHVFNFYYEPTDFNFYVNSSRSLMVVRLKTEVALDFINTLNDQKSFLINPIEINFQRFITQIAEISGAWFADLNKHHLKSAGYFGQNVNRSQEYIAAAKIGIISAINFMYPAKFNGEEYPITLSSKGSIFIRENLQDEQEELDVVLEIYEHLLKKAIPSKV